MAKSLFRIPLALSGHTLADFPYLVIEEHEFGDPYSVTIRLPEELNGKISLPRSVLQEIADAVRLPDEPTQSNALPYHINGRQSSNI